MSSCTALTPTGFYINLPVGGACAILFLLSFKTPEAAKPQPATWTEKLLQLDLVGSALMICATTCLELALQWGGITKSWVFISSPCASVRARRRVYSAVGGCRGEVGEVGK